jgi:metabolite-proton symporter
MEKTRVLDGGRESAPANAAKPAQPMSVPAPRRILLASLIGTAIEFFDFYSYATAAVIVFPRLFFPASDPATATLQSFATFGLAFFARPLGAALFGYFGDRIGRKSTLVAALLTMGLATIAIGLLPTYSQIGLAAPVLLGLCRFAQGLGLGGEWGGAVLLATENAPPDRRAWYGMFPQLGAPIGFLASTGVFLLLTMMNEAAFLDWGWRVPFLASAALVFVGLYVRLRLSETLEFRRVTVSNERVRNPLRLVVTHHRRALLLGMLVAAATYAILYLMTVFSLSWVTSQLGYPRSRMLLTLMGGMALLGIAIPVSARLAQRWSPTAVLSVAIGGLAVFGVWFGPLLEAGGFGMVMLTVALGLTLAGFSYGPLGAALAELFPTPVRYTGISLSFNLAGILGASLTPYIATWLATEHGLSWVGYYLSLMVVCSWIALLALGRA